MCTSPRYVIAGLDNGCIHILDHEGANERVVKASETGLWAVDTWGDEWVVAGGIDGLLRVWDLERL